MQLHTSWTRGQVGSIIDGEYISLPFECVFTNTSSFF